jgi:type VI secretion system protein ImpJ
MSWNNKVIWAEGLFLRPHHFQQHDRYLENLIDARCGGIQPYGWGVSELELNRNLLAMGKVALVAARGILPDGTPFSIPGDDQPPVPLEVPENVHNQVVYLAIPVRQPGTPETYAQPTPDGMVRFLTGELELKDNNASDQSPATVQVGRLHLRLLLDQHNRDGYACTGIARIVECKADKTVLLDEEFMPSALDFKAAGKLGGFVTELHALLRHRAEALAARVSTSGRGGVAEIADFMLLQLVNRLEPLAAHLATMSGLHPESLYRLLLPIAGELATFTTQAKRAPGFPPYRHEDLQASFTPVMAALRQSLSMVLEQNAIPIPLEERKYGIRVAAITDRKLLTQAAFVLAVNAQVSPEVLRSRFPAQTKIGSVEQIRELVNLALPGIGLRPLPVAPRQIPYHAGYTYFELDRGSQYWKQLEQSGGFAMHIAGEFPGLELEFWAIKG